MGRIVHTEGDRGGKELVDSLREMRTGGETREGTQNPDALYEGLPTGIYVARCRWVGVGTSPKSVNLETGYCMILQGGPSACELAYVDIKLSLSLSASRWGTLHILKGGDVFNRKHL